MSKDPPRFYRQLSSGTLPFGLAVKLIMSTRDHGIEWVVIPDPQKYDLADAWSYELASMKPMIAADLVYGFFVVLPDKSRVELIRSREPQLFTYNSVGGLTEFLEGLGFSSFTIQSLTRGNILPHEYLVSHWADGTLPFANPNTAS